MWTHYVIVHFLAGKVNIGVFLCVKLGKTGAYMQILLLYWNIILTNFDILPLSLPTNSKVTMLSFRETLRLIGVNVCAKILLKPTTYGQNRARVKTILT